MVMVMVMVMKKAAGDRIAASKREYVLQAIFGR
jgi:hypothetical protein